MQAYVRIFQTVKVWVVTLESHYDQSLIYLESAQFFIVGTVVHRCAPLHTRFLQEHFLKCVVHFVLMDLLSQSILTE